MSRILHRSLRQTPPFIVSVAQLSEIVVRLEEAIDAALKESM